MLFGTILCNRVGYIAYVSWEKGKGKASVKGPYGVDEQTDAKRVLRRWERNKHKHAGIC